MLSDRILVTGGLGFLGSAYIRGLSSDTSVINIDCRTYAADENRLADATAAIENIELDLADTSVRSILEDAEPGLIVHFAAATHVTRSETDPEIFFRTNVEGSRQLFEDAAAYGRALVVHISTDEVYGPAGSRPFSETDKQEGEGKATSAYARSKAIADDLARSMTDHLPLIVLRPTNCFGPWQHPEKAIARWTVRALLGRDLPVWGDGGQVRDWMYVDEAIGGINQIVERGDPGETYNLAPQARPRTNLEVARMIARLSGQPEERVFRTAYDRPNHDDRYWIDSTKVQSLGWSNLPTLDERLAATVSWYRDHEDWWLPLMEDAEEIYADDASALDTKMSTRLGPPPR